MCRWVSVFGNAWMKASSVPEVSFFIKTSTNPYSSICTSSTGRQQILGIQLVKRLGHEQAVLADQPPVEAYLAAAVIRALDANHVPVDLGLVAVSAVIVGLARGEVKRPGDLLV